MPLASQIKTLIVDDQKSVREVLASHLHTLGFTDLVQRKNAQEVLEYVKDTPLHLIISDYNMPEMDGIELLKSIRKNSKTAKIAFIMLTGEANQKLVQEAIAAGVNNFLVKPYTPAKLKDAIEKVFGAIR